jgi:hypothetical protein
MTTSGTSPDPVAPPEHPPASPVPPRSDPPRDPLSQVCSEVAGVFRRAWGRGPVKTTAYWCGPSAIVVLLENGHTDAEKTMRAAGHIQELLGGRQLLQVLIEDDLKAAVQRILKRPVPTMLSATRLDPDLSAEVFLLGPEGPCGSGDPGAA